MLGQCLTSNPLRLDDDGPRKCCCFSKAASGRITTGLLPGSQCVHETMRCQIIPSADWKSQKSHVNKVKLLLGIDVSNPA
jgi:hypothetical protein